MATKLSEKIRQSAQNLRQTQQQAPAGGATQQAFQASQVGQGKAPTQPLGQSNISEILAIQDARAQGEQAAQQIEAQADQTQVKEAEQAAQERVFDATQTANKLETDAQYNQQLDDQLNKYEQFSLDMTEQEEDLALEKMGFELMLKDKKYMAYLDQAGRQGRLNNELEYRKEVANQVYGEKLAETMRQIGFMENQYELDSINIEKLAQIDINSAIAAANAALQDDLRAQESAAWGQLGKAAGTAISGAKEADADTTTPTPDPRESAYSPNRMTKG